MWKPVACLKSVTSLRSCGCVAVASFLGVPSPQRNQRRLEFRHQVYQLRATTRMHLWELVDVCLMTLSVTRLCSNRWTENRSPNVALSTRNRIWRDLGSNPGHSGRQPCICNRRYLRFGGTYWLSLQGGARRSLLTVILLNLPSHVMECTIYETHYIVLPVWCLWLFFYLIYLLII
jgi:hypothetical protein